MLAAAPAPAALELGPADVPSHPDAVMRSAEHLGPDRFVTEAWILAPPGLSHQELGARGYRAAEECVEGMRRGGWELTAENWQRRGGEFTFRKEVIKEAKLSVGTAAKPIAGEMQPYVSIRHRLERLIPTHDLKGIDLPDAPRYPGSTRVRWMHLQGEYAAKYLVVAPLAEVRSFYESELPRHGWVAGRGVGTLNYTRGGVTSPGDRPADVRPGASPVETVGKMIPSTLAVHLSEEDGIVSIGIGRSAGAGDAEAWAELPVTPERSGERDDHAAPLLTSLDPGELPVYDGLVHESQRREPMSTGGEQITVHRYRMEAPPAEAIAAAEFYLAEMQQRGWSLVDEEWHGLSRALRFRQGAVRVEIGVKAVGPLGLRDSPKPIPVPVEVRLILPLPAADVAGEDIEGVPRLPGSVRFYHLKVAIDHLVKFKAPVAKEEAEWFFIEELPQRGWTFAGNDATGLLFVPAGTAGSATAALAAGQLIPTTLKVVIDDMRDGTVKVGTALTRGDS